MVTAVSATTTTADGAAAMKKATGMNKDDFLKLFVTQLQHQDPLNPQDGNQFIAQLAQFSQLEELKSLSSKVDAMTVATASSSQLTTTQLVGKQALFHADRIGLVAGQGSKFQLSLPEAATLPEGIDFYDAVARYERQIIESALRRAGGVQKVAAEALGLKPTTLNEKIKRLGISI